MPIRIEADWPRFSALNFFSATAACAVSWSLRMFSGHFTETGSTNDGPATESTRLLRRVAALRWAPAEVTSASSQEACATHPGGASSSGSPQASLTSEPVTREPSIFARAPTVERVAARNRVHDVDQETFAVTSTCSAASQLPSSSTSSLLSTRCSLPVPWKVIV